MKSVKFMANFFLLIPLLTNLSIMAIDVIEKNLIASVVNYHLLKNQPTLPQLRSAMNEIAQGNPGDEACKIAAMVPVYYRTIGYSATSYPFVGHVLKLAQRDYSEVEYADSAVVMSRAWFAHVAFAKENQFVLCNSSYGPVVLAGTRDCGECEKFVNELHQAFLRYADELKEDMQK